MHPQPQEELAQIGGSWGDLKRNAFVVDAALRGSFGDDGSGGDGSSGGGSGIIGAGGGAARRFTTLCHGDAKSANFMFSKDGKAAAAYDFQVSRALAVGARCRRQARRLGG